MVQASGLFRPLPGLALGLIGIATALLWVGVLLLFGAVLWFGPGVVFDGAFAFGSDRGPPGIADALMVQAVVTFLGYLGVLILGSLVLFHAMRGASDQAAAMALVFVRFLIGFIIVRSLVNWGLNAVVTDGSLVAMAPIIAATLPFLLVEIGALIFADAYLRRPPDSIF